MKRLRTGATALAASTMLAIGAVAAPAVAQVYKCTDAAGHTVYADAPCGPVAAPLRLPDEPTKSTASPTACAQLKDELDRLDAQADRDAERGRKQSAGTVARRKSLGKQYAERCVGIARSGSSTK